MATEQQINEIIEAVDAVMVVFKEHAESNYVSPHDNSVFDRLVAAAAALKTQ
jgi:predicted nucleic acid-binding protein